MAAGIACAMPAVSPLSPPTEIPIGTLFITATSGFVYNGVVGLSARR